MNYIAPIRSVSPEPTQKVFDPKLNPACLSLFLGHYIQQKEEQALATQIPLAKSVYKLCNLIRIKDQTKCLGICRRVVEIAALIFPVLHNLIGGPLKLLFLSLAGLRLLAIHKDRNSIRENERLRFEMDRQGFTDRVEIR